MTPQEKAKQLVAKFTFHYIYFANGIDGSKLNATSCAKLAVDEILKAIQDINYVDVNWDYWQEVKTEIGKL